MWVILALVVHFGWNIGQLDVSNAYLRSTLHKEVYMEQPRGFIDQPHPEYVFRLHKALYGVKHVPRAWFTRLLLEY
jgi:hypothetical protein